MLMLTQYFAFGDMPGGASGVIATGPFFIDHNNINQILTSAAHQTF